MQRITVQMIEEQSFQNVPNGYSPKQVDEFLDAICDEMIRQEEETNAVKQQLSALKSQQLSAAPTVQMRPVQKNAYAAPAATEQSSKDALEVLALAQKLKAETLAEAQRQADEIMAKAQAEAEAKLGSLTAERDQIAAQLENMKRAAKAYRDNFEALIAQQKEVLDAGADLF